MAAELVPDIFNPYFTTKSSGTGLGLAIVHRIIEAHGGEIKVESVVGQGTVFTLLLPATGRRS
jgi:two-component system sensor histidine kinase HydH